MLSTFQDNFGEAVIPLTYMYSCAPKRTMTYSSLAAATQFRCQRTAIPVATLPNMSDAGW